MSADHWYTREVGMTSQLRCGTRPIATFDSYLTAQQCQQVANTLNLVQELADALRTAASFIENVGTDDPQRTQRFFKAREAWRNALAKVQS